MSTFQNAPCKLCGVSSKLIKRSHIIPDFMYKGIHDEKHRMVIVNTKEVNSKSKFAQSGFHEKFILCEKCESRFSVFERHTSLVLYEGSKGQIFVKSGISKDGLPIFFINGIDYSKFKLCFLSILWRAHVSANKFFQKVDISEIESEIRKMLLNNDCKGEDEYKIGIIGVQKFDKKFINIVLDPAVISLSNGKIAMFFINGFFYFIDLKPKSSFELLKTFYLKENGEMEIPILSGELAKYLLMSVGVSEDFANYFTLRN